MKPKIIDLEIDQELIFKNKKEWPKKQDYAHVVARRKGWKISAVWDEEQNCGIVRRIK